MSDKHTDILYVMAADQEYGPHLQQRIKPLLTGVGPVEAAIVLAGELSRRKAADAMPRLVVSLGSAGSRTLEQTEVYQAVSVSYRDMDASPLGFAKGTTPFLDLPAVILLPHRIAGLPEARLSTGANIVSGKDYDQIDADMVDMETFAHMRAAMTYDISLVGLRGISDGREELRHVGDWTEYLHIIDEKLAAAVDQLEADFTNGALDVRA